MTPEEQAQLNKLLKEGIELAKKLNDAAAETSLRNFNGDLKTAQLAVDSLRSEWKEYISDIAGARLGFTRIVDEIKNMNSGVGAAKKAFSGLSSIAAKLQSHQEGINTLSSKELNTLKSKIDERVNDLKLAGRLAKDEVVQLETKKRSGSLNTAEKKQLTAARIAHANITQEITKGIGFTKQLNEQAAEQLKIQEQIEKTLGLSGALMKGISKIPFLKDIPGMSNVLNEVEKEIKKINALREKEGKEPLSRAEALKMTFSKMKGVVIKNLTDPLVIVGFLVTQFIDALKTSDKATGKLAKDFNLTYNEAANVRNELIQIGNLSGDVALNARALQETMVAVGQSLGSNAMLNQADLEIFTKLREQAGFTNEELIGIEKTTLATGGNLKNNVQNLMFAAKTTGLNNKVLLNEKDIMRDVSKASDAIKLSVGGSGKALGAAAAQAKALGMNLGQVDKIAESLLNFEQSISAELEAELLTGRDLNLEQARLYAINNNMEGLSRELAKNFGTAAEFSKMNRLQQEAAAKAVGMSREELAKTLTDKEALAKMSSQDPKLAEKTLEFARQKGMTDKEISELKEKDFENLMRQQSVQERLNASVEKLKEIFISIAEPVLQIVSPFVDLVTNILPLINIILTPALTTIKYIGESISGWLNMFSGGLDKLTTMQKIVGFIGAAIITWKVGMLAYNGVLAISAAIQALLAGEAIATASAITLGLGLATIIGGIIMGVGAMKSASNDAAQNAKSMKDGIIDPYKGPVLSGDFGSVQLNPRDRAMYDADGRIKVGTNLLGNNKPTPPPTPAAAPTSQPVIVNYTAPQTVIAPERIATSLEMQYRV
jgi:hypothetical protein